VAATELAAGVGPKDLGAVPVRVALGATLLYHGASKLRRDGAAQAAGFFEQLGIRPGRTWATLTGLAEVAAGATTILGIATRLGALAVIATQAVAIAKVHRGKGFDNTAGGWEFNALLIAVALGLLTAGPGTASLHEAVERRFEGGVRWLLEPRRRRRVRLAKLLK
jgi:putative oxidoreductase